MEGRYTHRRRNALLPLLAALAWGCDAADFSEIDVPREVMAPASPAALGADPLFVVSNEDEDGHPPLHIVWGAALTPEGGIILANEGSTSFLVFDSVGSFEHEVGSRGEAPGEFRRVHGVEVLSGESYLTWDRAAARMTLFMPGEAPAVVPADPVEGAPFDDAIALPPDRIAAIHQRVPNRSPRGFSRLPIFVRITDLSGNEVARLGPFSGLETFGAGGFSVWVPFGHRFHAAGTSAGMFLGSGRTPELLHLDREGTPKRHLVLPISEREITAEERSRAIDAQRPSPERRRVIEEAFQWDILPAYSDLVAGRDGSLWVRVHEGSDPLGEWLIVDPAAGEVSRIFLPVDAELLAASADRVALTFQAPEGDEAIHVYEYRRTP